MNTYRFWWDAGGEVDSFYLQIDLPIEEVKTLLEEYKKQDEDCYYRWGWIKFLEERNIPYEDLELKTIDIEF